MFSATRGRFRITLVKTGEFRSTFVRLISLCPIPAPGRVVFVTGAFFEPRHYGSAGFMGKDLQRPTITHSGPGEGHLFTSRHQKSSFETAGSSPQR